MGYPTDIKSLTGLRFVAAFWLLLYFFWGRLGIPPEATPGVIAMGYLGVDLFFILSGFVLAHVYGPQVEARQFHYGSFVWARLARVYPLHLACLLAMVALWAVGLKMGATFPDGAFEVAHIPAHLGLVHAWGILGSDGWNFPSWSISAEWFAYLLFPVLFGAAAVFRASPWAGVGAGVALFMGLFAVMARFDIELTDMTWQGGILRIVPSFICGVALWFLGRRITAGPKTALVGLVTSVMWLVVTSELKLSPAAVWPALAALVFFTAETAKHAPVPVFGSRSWVYLGEISFAVYIIHLPVDIALYQVVERVLGKPEGVLAIGIGALAVLATIGAAAVAHALIEKPARDWMRAHPPGPFSRPAATVAAPAG